MTHYCMQKQPNTSGYKQTIYKPHLSHAYSTTKY